MPDYSHIFLDLDDTILDFHQAEHLAAGKTLSYFGIEPTPAVLNRYSELNEQQWKLLEQGLLERSEVKTRRYRLLFEELHVQASEKEAADMYEHYLSIGHFFLPGAEQLLADLKHTGHHLYLVSNGSTEVQKGRLASAGIIPCFDHIFISEEIGRNKPDPAFFSYCFSQIPDFHPADGLIIGDSLTSDIRGGKQAGLCTIWLNRQHLTADSTCLPDHIISDLSEVMPLLK